MYNRPQKRGLLLTDPQKTNNEKDRSPYRGPTQSTVDSLCLEQSTVPIDVNNRKVVGTGTKKYWEKGKRQVHKSLLYPVGTESLTQSKDQCH